MNAAPTVPSRRNRAALVVTGLAVLLVLGAGLTLAGLLASQRRADHDDVVEHDVGVVMAGLQGVVERAAAGLAGAPAILDASGEPSVARFDDFARGISADAPVIATALATVVDDADRPAFEAAHGFDIVEGPRTGNDAAAGRQATYYPVVAMYPDTPRFQVMLGVDIAQDAARGVAAEASVESGEAAVTPPSTLAYTGEPGVLVVQPLFRPDAPVATADERRDALVGYVSVSYSLADLLAEAEAPTTELADVVVLDAANATGAAAAPPGGWIQRPFELGDRDWVIRARPAPAPSWWPPVLVVGVALLVAALLAEIGRRSWRYDRELGAWGDALVAQQRRTLGLQSLTATLTSAVTVTDVSAAVLDQGVPLAGASSGRLELEAEPGQEPPPPPSEPSGGNRGDNGRERPIRSGDTVLGRLVASYPAGAAVTTQDEAMLNAVAALAGDALGRARRYDSEHQMVNALQALLLPVLPQRLGSIEVAAMYRPVVTTTGVGGDWYDILDTDAGPACVIGDVVGKGVRAAGVMGQLRIATRTLAGRDDPAGMLDALDDFANEFNDAYMTTFAYVVIDLQRHVLRTGVAGHPPPLLLPVGAPGRWLGDGAGPPLGVRPAGGARTSVEVPWEGPARLLLYTDGLVERRGEPIDAGLERLRQAAQELAGSPPAQFIGELADALAPVETQSDDIAILCVDLPSIG